MKNNCESYKQYCLRKLMEIADELDGEERSVVDYVIGYLIGIGWSDIEQIRIY